MYKNRYTFFKNIRKYSDQFIVISKGSPHLWIAGYFHTSFSLKMAKFDIKTVLHN